MTEAPGARLSEASRRQLQALLDRLARIAGAVRPWARAFTVFGLFGALWLAWQVQLLAGWPLWGAAIVLLVLALPALVCGWLWWLLVDMAELPEVAERTLGMIGPGRDTAPPDAGVSDVFKLGGSLRKAASLAMDVDSIYTVIVGVMVLANPIFLLVLGVAIVAATGLGIIAAFGLLIGLLF